MVKVTSMMASTVDKKATVDLFADTKAEMTGLDPDDIIGFPKRYQIDMGSSVFTASGELAFMQSDGTWNWVE